MDCTGTQDDLAVSRNGDFFSREADPNPHSAPAVEFDSQHIRIRADRQIRSLTYWSQECIGGAESLASPDRARLVSKPSRGHRIEIVDVLDMGCSCLCRCRDNSIAQGIRLRMNCHFEWPGPAA